MRYGRDLANLHKITDAEILAWHPDLAPEDFAEVKLKYRAVDAALDAAQITCQPLQRVRHPQPVPDDELDAVDLEARQRHWFMSVVGRPATLRETMGPQRPGCDPCARMSGLPCDSHRRRMGEPMPLPPESEWRQRVGPGATVIPYSLLNSVADASGDGW